MKTIRNINIYIDIDIISANDCSASYNLSCINYFTFFLSYIL